jgi:hypothetical protein
MKSGGLAAGLAHAAAAFADTPFPYLLGMALIYVATKWDGHLHDQKGCFQLQEIKGIVYKVDTCTGKAEELRQKPNDRSQATPQPGPVVPPSSAKS